MIKRDWYCEDVLSGAVAVDIVWQDENVLAFHHLSPTWPVHVVVVPRAHIDSVLDESALDGALWQSIVRAVQAAARALNLDKEGFFVRMNAAAPRETPHLHLHVCGPGIP